jgi:hypothetical protein
MARWRLGLASNSCATLNRRPTCALPQDKASSRRMLQQFQSFWTRAVGLLIAADSGYKSPSNKKALSFAEVIG